jgi:hypothetical protein
MHEMARKDTLSAMTREEPLNVVKTLAREAESRPVLL